MIEFIGPYIGQALPHFDCLVIASSGNVNSDDNEWTGMINTIKSFFQKGFTK